MANGILEIHSYKKYIKGDRIQMSTYFLGVDGGNTKTHIALYQPETGLVDLYTGGGSNYEVMEGGYAELSIVLKKMFDEFLGKHGITTANITRAALGMAGVDTKTQQTEIAKVLRGLGLTDFSLENDCVLGIKAASTNGYGISCVSGTGFSVFGLDENNNALQIGGMGDVTGDFGGGGYVVRQAIAYVFGNLYKRYPASKLTDMLMTRMKITSKSDFMEALHHHVWGEDRRRFNLDVSKMVFQAAKEGDAAAIDILTTSSKAYGESVLGIIDNLTYNAPPEIVLIGSLFQKNPESILVTALEQFLDENYKKPYVTKVLDAPSVLGALVWAIGDVPEEKRKELSTKLINIGA